MDYPKLTKTLMTLLLSITGLILLAWWQGHHYINLMLPLYETIISWNLPDGFRVVGMTQTGGSRGQFINLVTATTQPLTAPGQIIPEGIKIDSSTLRGHAYQLPITALGILLAWPKIQLKHRILLITAACPVIILASLIDIPMVLLGAFTDFILYSQNPGTDPKHLLITWMTLMDDGGRVAVGAAVALSSIAAYKYYSSWFAQKCKTSTVPATKTSKQSSSKTACQ